MITRFAYRFQILLHLGYAGCYHTSQLTRDDLIDQTSREIDVFTVDARHYRLPKDSYNIHADTLYGKALDVFTQETMLVPIVIPLCEIKNIETKKVSYGPLVGPVLVSLFVVTCMVAGNPFCH